MTGPVGAAGNLPTFPSVLRAALPLIILLINACASSLVENGPSIAQIKRSFLFDARYPFFPFFILFAFVLMGSVHKKSTLYAFPSKSTLCVLKE